MSIEAMKLALEALENSETLINGTDDSFGLAGAMDGYYSDCFDLEKNEKLMNQAITSLRQAIEQAEKQEPFGYFQYAMHFDAWVQNRDSNKGVAFYTTPQPQRELNCVCGAVWEGDEMVCVPHKREWVGLTDEERNHARQTITYSQLAMTAGEWTEAVQIETERRLKEKNK